VAINSSPGSSAGTTLPAAKTNPLKGNPELVAGGQKVFARMRAMCHEAGEAQLGPKLSSAAVQKENDGALFWKVSNGNSRTGMPGLQLIAGGATLADCAVHP
jgi:hypothetical protein